MEIGILVLAVILRLWALDIKPPHFDEGVNGWFADRMTETGFYRYDPTNYHGPLHMYAVFVSQSLLGRNLWALRLPAVIASVLAVWALLRLAPYFGKFPARFAGLAMAVSPAFVFYGRYSIHESWMVLFLILCLHGFLGLWQDGDKKSLITLGVGVTGLVLTKETYIIHLGSYLLAFGCLWVWQKVVPSRPGLGIAVQTWRWPDVGWVAGLSIVAILLFYSGFFLNPSGVLGLYQTFAAWFETGVEAAGHEKEEFQFGPLNFYWVYLMARYEWPALAGFAACIWALFPVDARVRYTAIYGAGVLLAYSIIPYKTPWCVISIIWPFYLVAGSLLQLLAARWRVIAGTALAASSVPTSLDLNFRKFTDDAEPYVYVQTFEGLNTACDPLLAKARQDPRFYFTDGSIYLESYYPIPWVLGDFTNIGYYTEDHVIPDFIDQAFVFCSEEDADAIQAALSGAYYRRDFRLRSGMTPCVAFFRYDVFKDILGGPPDVIGTAEKQSSP